MTQTATYTPTPWKYLKACNSHAELLEACKRLVRGLPCNCRNVKAVAGDSAQCDACFGRAAIAKAEPKP